MDQEPSSFETSEMLGRFLASTHLVPESWKVCARANVMGNGGFMCDEVDGVVYVGFSGVVMGDGLDLFCGKMVGLSDDGVFHGLVKNGDDDGDLVMVDAGLLRLFFSLLNTPVFQNQMFEIKKKQKPVVFTGHSIGGAIAALASLWLLSYLQSISSPPSVLCFTFGSPLIGNESLSRAIQQQRWSGNFCHIVSKHDIIPRLLFAPVAPIITHVHTLLKSCHLTMNSPFFIRDLGPQLTEHEKNELFQFVLHYLEVAIRSLEVGTRSLPFVPFGNFMFCSSDGAVCIEDTKAIVRMLCLMFASGSPSSCIDDHLEYESYVEKISLQYLKRDDEELYESNTYEAGVTLASQSVSSGHLRNGASRRNFKVYLNREKLGKFWDNVIDMLEKNQLPHDFHKRAKWVYASHSYQLLVEPLDIAEYYRSDAHRIKGHYLKDGREKRYKILDKWWRERDISGENDNNYNSGRRSKFASLTQDSCFWAKVEEARECVENVKNERDPLRLSVLWTSIEKFNQYSRGMIERKEVSTDVLAKNSSYMVLVEELRGLTNTWCF
ncbi:Lipase, class 3 [Artemisia annua]|uniref:Lipase, class 3 n=1 Tax=Artemisia annua TaxID=35608 RepID=A0A2U1NY93_ARTAN|nr:Lipase, class 3 [Artemisia annua]